MKKVLFALAVVLVISGGAFAASHRLGMIEYSSIQPDEFNQLREQGLVFASGTEGYPKVTFYKSINELMLALNAGDIDEIGLPEPVGTYVLSTHPEYVIKCISVVAKTPMLLSFGFKEENTELAEKFNKALADMKRDGTLITLQGRYINSTNTAVLEERFITDPNMNAPAPVVFKKFENAPTVKIAVTGDLPPIDYIAADGKPEGFNTAIISEICGRLGLNVELINIDSGARAAMLASGRADVSFWFEHRRGLDTKYDVPEGVILSEPYYEFDTFYHLGK